LEELARGLEELVAEKRNFHAGWRNLKWEIELIVER